MGESAPAIKHQILGATGSQPWRLEAKLQVIQDRRESECRLVYAAQIVGTAPDTNQRMVKAI